jgi:dTDP-4-dehydrorhamnose 3,5-epimerase
MRRDVGEFDGLKLVTARHFSDERGYLLQSWVKTLLDEAGIPSPFLQAIQSVSRRGVIRGLHFQWDPPMGKLVRCVAGAVIDVAVDVRHGSPTLGDHARVELSDRNHSMFWIPPGFAHGFAALADDTIVLYECSSEHSPNEGGIRWSDPELGIEWPAGTPVVSDKDRQAPTLTEWLADPRSRHFRAA